MKELNALDRQTMVTCEGDSSTAYSIYINGQQPQPQNELKSLVQHTHNNNLSLGNLGSESNSVLDAMLNKIKGCGIEKGRDRMHMRRKATRLTSMESCCET